MCIRDRAGRIRWQVGGFHEALLEEAWLVIAATDDHAVNRTVYAVSYTHLDVYKRQIRVSR